MHIFNCPVPFYTFKYYRKLLGDTSLLVGREEMAPTAQSHASQSSREGSSCTINNREVPLCKKENKTPANPIWGLGVITRQEMLPNYA